MARRVCGAELCPVRAVDGLSIMGTAGKEGLGGRGAPLHVEDVAQAAGVCVLGDVVGHVLPFPMQG
jgi:hypothetical protein